MDPLTITIEVKTTENPRIKIVDGKLCVGRVEVRQAMTAAAKEQIQRALDELFPVASA